MALLSRQEAADKAEEKGKGGLNTKIGWPSNYWGHGLWAFLGYVAVCVLLGWAMVIMATLVTCDVKLDEPLLSIIWTAGLLIAAAVVLQTLPAVESGLQFIPTCALGLLELSPRLPLYLLLAWPTRRHLRHLDRLPRLADRVLGGGVVLDGDERPAVIRRLTSTLHVPASIFSNAFSAASRTR